MIYDFILLTVVVIAVTSIVRAGSALIAVTLVSMVVRAVHTLLHPASGPQCCPDDGVRALDREHLAHLSGQTGDTEVTGDLSEQLEMNVTTETF